MLVDTPYIANEKKDSNEEGGKSDEDDLTKNIWNKYNLVEQTGKPIGNSLAKTENNAIHAAIKS